MGFLIGLGLLGLFSAALMHPYGRRLLGTMLFVCVVIIGGLILLFQYGERNQAREQAAEAAAASVTIPPLPVPPVERTTTP